MRPSEQIITLLGRAGGSVAPTVVSASIRSQVPFEVQAVSSNNLNGIRVYDFSSVNIQNPSGEYWNGMVLSTLASAPQEIDGLSPVTIIASLLTGVDATQGQSGANQSAATLTPLSWSNVKNDVAGYLFKKDGTAATYAQFVADGGSVTTTTNANDTLNCPTWGYYCKFDRPTGVTIAALTAYALQINETRPAPLAISSCSQSGTTVTVVTTNPHGLLNSERRHMAGFTPSGYNTVVNNAGVVITVVDASTFTYQATGGLGVVTVLGTVQALRPTAIRTQTVPATENPFGDVAQTEAAFTNTPVNSKNWLNNMALQTGNLLCPYFARIDGISPTGKKFVAVKGDSIFEGVNDGNTLNPSGSHLKGDAYGALNFTKRALRSAGYSYTSAAVPGTAPGTENTFGGGAIRNLIGRGCAAIIDGHMHNSITATGTYSALLTLMQTYWAADRAANPGAKLISVTPVPLTTSSDSWATRVNQSNSGAFLTTTGYVYANLIPYLLGTLIPANGDPDAVIDANAILMALDSGSDRSKWPATGTAFGYASDGTHPCFAASAGMAPGIASVLPTVLGF